MQLQTLGSFPRTIPSLFFPSVSNPVIIHSAMKCNVWRDDDGGSVLVLLHDTIAYITIVHNSNLTVSAHHHYYYLGRRQYCYLPLYVL